MSKIAFGNVWETLILDKLIVYPSCEIVCMRAFVRIAYKWEKRWKKTMMAKKSKDKKTWAISCGLFNYCSLTKHYETNTLLRPFVTIIVHIFCGSKVLFFCACVHKLLLPPWPYNHCHQHRCPLSQFSCKLFGESLTRQSILWLEWWPQKITNINGYRSV